MSAPYTVTIKGKVVARPWEVFEARQEAKCQAAMSPGHMADVHDRLGKQCGGAFFRTEEQRREKL